MEPQEQSTPSTSNGTNKKVGITIAVVAVLALIGITAFAGKKTVDTAAVPADTTSTATTTELPASTTPATTPSKTTGQTAATYKNGTYTATGSYMSPGGQDQVGVTLTLQSDIITDVTVTPMPGDNTSKKYQGIFAANYKPLVLGKDISTVKLDKVSGSSLTGKGFNDAIAKIEAQAKA